MIKRKTVLVLGAGASQPYGFPLGPALVDQVCAEILEEDSTLVSRLGLRGVKRNDCLEFAKALRDARPYSIDAFLEMREEYGKMGKLAIADILLRAENQRTLSATPQKVDWYRYLLNKSLVLRSRDNYLDQARFLTIVTFNFDRSFERALFSCLRAAFGGDDADTRELATKIQVHHIHGLLGQPSWLYPEHAEATAYGHHTSNVGRATRKALRSIKIVGEDLKDRSTLDAAEAALRKAHYIYFLGFGFDERNLQRLNAPDSIKHASVTATALGWSAAEIRETKRLLLGVDSLEMYPEDVISFLRERGEALFQ